jgi:hypothetical protein
MDTANFELHYLDTTFTLSLEKKFPIGRRGLEVAY